jgi:TolA-binding protein
MIRVGSSVARRDGELRRWSRHFWQGLIRNVLSEHVTQIPAMTDRTDALLAELVELQKRQLNNQELMLARQEQAVARQQETIRRQRHLNRSMWIFIGVLIAVMLLAPALNFLARTGH